MSTNRIFIIGMPGSGKSTIGKLLSSRLDLPYYDLDNEIESAQNKSIDQLFTSMGEEQFRIIENKLCQKLITTYSSFVMSTGGGTPCFYDTINRMNESGITIYLRAPPDLLVSRTEGKAHRPLLKNDHLSSLEQLYSIRKSCYEKANYTVRVEGKNQNTVLEETIELLR